ncbi:MAG: competence protein ComEA [Actinomycetota bacterium]|nr:competence protein ComEA [Actinomycetota bacterium]
MEDFPIRSGLGDRLSRLAGRRRDVQIVAAVVAVLGVLSFAAWSRSAPAAIAPPSTSPSFAPSLAPSTAPSALGQIYVHVAGAVRRPGLYTFPPGSRVVDAVEAAGGPKPGADLDAINLAEILVDATQIVVPGRGDDAAAAPTSPSSGASSSPSVVNLNTADQTLLETIPGVGPVTATSILQFRSEVGSFGSIDQLLEVDGIGPATLESIRPYVTI